MSGFTEWWERASPRERDAAVAEHVMVWTFERHTWPDGQVEEWYENTPHDRAGRYYGFYTWRPSEDIAAAWEVVEKMKADGWRWHMGGQYSGSQRPWCGFRQTAEDMDYIVSGDTAPEAICLAALKAVGYDPDE